MPQSPQEPTKDHDSLAIEALRSIGLTILCVVWLYVVFYWIFYRGGSYVLHHWILSNSPTTSLSPGTSSTKDALADFLKVVWSGLGAGLGAITAALVRRWYVFRAIKDKLGLLEHARLELLDLLQPYREEVNPAVGLNGGMLKYLFGEKEYAQLAKYLSADSAMAVLRTISAIDILASAARSASATEDIKRALPYVIPQLQAFNLPSLILELKLLRDNPDNVVNDVAESSASTK